MRGLLPLAAYLAGCVGGCVGTIGGTAGGGPGTGAGGSPNGRGGVSGSGTGGRSATGGSSPTGTGGQGTPVTPTDGAINDLKPQAPFVAVGYAALRAFSADGKTWTTAPAPTTLPSGWSGPPVSGDNQWNFRGGCYGEGLFVALGGTTNNMGLLMSSTNGSSWTLVGGAQSNDACAYGNGRFLTSVRTSTDGATWTTISTAISSRRMTFGNGLFVSVGDNGGGDVHYSSDGQTWQALPITYTGTDSNRLGYDALAYGNGHFLAANVMISSSPIFEWDGASTTSFTETPRANLLGSNVAITAMAYGRGGFVIASSNNMLYRRADGQTTWQASTYSGTTNLFSLVITDDLYVTDSAWSTDGATFTAGTNAPGKTGMVNLIVPTMQ